MDITKLEADFAAVKEEIKALNESEQRDEAAIDAKFAKLDEIQRRIDTHNKIVAAAFNAGTPVVKDAAKFEAIQPVEAKAYDTANFSTDASAWMLTGNTPSAEFATITTASGSSILLPRNINLPDQQSVGNAFRVGMNALGRQILTTENAAVEVVQLLDMGKGSQLAEGSTTESTGNAPDPLNSIVLNPKDYTSEAAWYSNTQLKNLGYDLFAELTPEAYDAKERSFEAAIVADVKALYDSTANSSAGGLSSAASTGGATIVKTASTSAITLAELQKARRTGPRRFDVAKIAVVHSDVYSAIEALADANGNPILVPDVANGELSKYRNMYVLRSDEFDTFGSKKVLGVVLSLRGFRMRDVVPAQLTRYVNNNIKRNSTGFELFQTHSHGFVLPAVTLITT